MIRFFPAYAYGVKDINGYEYYNNPAYNTFIVTAKRRVRGYVRSVPVDGSFAWMALGLNGCQGYLKKTRKEAAADLVSNRKYRETVVCNSCKSSFWDGDRCHGWLLDPCLKQAFTLVKSDSQAW